MFIRNVTLNELRARLTREEFEHVARANMGETITPRGWTVDEDMLDDELKDKVLNLVLDLRRENFER